MERAVGMHYGNALDHLEWYSVMEVQELAWVSKAGPCIAHASSPDN